MTIHDLTDQPVWTVVNEAEALHGSPIEKTIAIDWSPEQIPAIRLFAKQADADKTAKDTPGFVSSPLEPRRVLWAVLQACQNNGVRHVRYKPESGSEVACRIADFCDSFDPDLP